MKSFSQPVAADAAHARSLRRRLVLVLGAVIATLVILMTTATIIAARSLDGAALERALYYVGAGGLVGMVILAVVIDRVLDRRLTAPLSAVAAAAEAVAKGDLTVRLTRNDSNDQVGRLSRAVSQMISELTDLAGALGGTAYETASMATEITASAEEMAASAGEIATTASDLSQQASTMASAVQALTESSGELVTIATSLQSGARDGVERNLKLRTLATENRARLDESARALELLGGEVEGSARAVAELARASGEIRSFVTLVQKLARQSKLLALNAAMEAARAGDQGEGFAVVASEVRRLSTMSSDAAERTEQIVAEVLKGVETTRLSSGRSVETVRAVRSATEQGSLSFGLIEGAVEELDAWTSAISGTATAASALVGEVNARLGALSHGVESIAAAMEEVAASSQQQSASTEEIAAAASTLTNAGDRLTKLATRLKTGEQPQHRRDSRPAPTPAPAPHALRPTGRPVVA